MPCKDFTYCQRGLTQIFLLDTNILIQDSPWIAQTFLDHERWVDHHLGHEPPAKNCQNPNELVLIFYTHGDGDLGELQTTWTSVLRTDTTWEDCDIQKYNQWKKGFAVIAPPTNLLVIVLKVSWQNYLLC